MTIAANDKKTKARKKKNASIDALAKLKATMKAQMAAEKTKARNKATKPALATSMGETVPPTPAPVAPKAEPKPSAKPAPALAPMPVLRDTVIKLKAVAEKMAAGSETPADALSAALSAASTAASAFVAPQPAPTKTAAPPLSMGDTTPHWPDAAEWTGFMLRVAERSHKILKEFTERNKTFMEQVTSYDPAHLSEAFLELSERLSKTPEKFVTSQLALWQDYVRVMQMAIARMSGKEAQPVISPAKSDKRFKDVAWQEVWLFDYIKQTYLLTSEWIQSLIRQVDGIDPRILRKVDFYTRQFTDAMSPSNFIITNPEVLRTTLATGGENLIKGLEHLLGDLERGRGQLLISMSDQSAFKFGDNIATTKGKVVYQNDLMQLIQFSPLTDTVHKTPFLIVPPWINKYYILDLRADNSMIRYLVQQGFTVFCISWVNPDERHAHMGFDDYMTLGPLAALREIGTITGEKKVNALGYCIGGTLLTCTLAYLKALNGKQPPEGPVPAVNSATYLVTMIDFAEPGEIGVFIDEDQVGFIEALMAKQGYLGGSMMATAFSFMRANDLVWSFVVNNYLLGREPFPFDLLAWNADSTNLPAAMQSFYLRNMYLENKLVESDGITLKDTPLDVHQIDIPVFALGTREDHITPWRSTYAVTQLFKGPVKYVLSGSGHIAGVVNPPEKRKYCYWTNDNNAPNPEDWFGSATQTDGSWWPEWIRWLKPLSGEMVAARDPSANGRAIEDAPGSYVRVKSS